MPGPNDVRAGGAYVETYVKRDELDKGLAEINRKVRTSLGVVMAVTGAAGKSTVAAGALTLGAISSVIRAGAGFAKGFSNPSRQAASDTRSLAAAVGQLKPAIAQVTPPVKQLVTLFTGFGPKIVNNIGAVRTALRSMLTPGQFSAFDRLYQGLFQASPKVRAEIDATRKTAEKLAGVPDWIGRRGPRKSRAKNDGADFIQVAGYTKKDGTQVGSYIRNAKSQPKSIGTALASVNQTGGAVASLQPRYQKTNEDIKKLKASAAAGIAAVKNIIFGSPAQWATTKGAIIANLFGSSLERGMAKAAQRASDAARVQLAGERGFLSGRIASAQVIARRLIPAGVGAAIGVAIASGMLPVGTLLFGTAGTAMGTSLVAGAVAVATKGGALIASAVGSKLVMGASAGAAMIAKPRQSLALLAGLAKRTFAGIGSAIGAIGGKRASAQIDQVGYAAMRAKGPLGQVAHAATAATSRLAALAGVGSRVVGNLSKVGLVSAGIVTALSAAAGVSSGTFSSAFNFSEMNPEAITKTSQALGLTVEQTSRLSAAASLGGSSMQSMQGALNHVTDLVKDGSDKLAKYGLSLEGMKNASPERKLELVAAAMSQITDPAKKSQAALDLLGTTDLNQVMANFDGLRSRAQQLGGVLSGEDVAAAMKFKSSMAEMHLASKSLGSALSAAVMPQLIGMAQQTTTMVQGMVSWAQANRPLIASVFSIAKQVGLFVGIVSAGSMILSRFAFLVPAISFALTFLASPVGLVTAGIIAMTMACSHSREAVLGAFNAMTTGASEAWSVLSDSFNGMRDDFETTWGGIVDAVSAGDLALAGEVAMAGITAIFDQGWATVHSAWMSFRDDFLAGWDNMVLKVKVAGEEMFPGFESNWADTVAFMEDAWTIFVNGMLSAWDQGFGYLQKSINYLKSLFKDAFDLEGANAAIDKKIAERQKERQAKQDETIGGRLQQRDAHAQAVKDKGLEQALKDENQAARDARKKSSDAAREADQKRLEAAREQLQQVRERARSARAQKADGVKSDAIKASEQAKSGNELSKKLASSADIRTKEGLTNVLGARGQSPLNKMLNVNEQSLAEQKRQSELQYKIWKQQQDGLIPAWPGS